MKVDVHLRIKKAECSLDNRYGLIERLDLIQGTCLARNDSHEVESQILWVQIGREAIRQALLLSSRNLDIISR